MVVWVVFLTMGDSLRKTSAIAWAWDSFTINITVGVLPSLLATNLGSPITIIWCSVLCFLKRNKSLYNARKHPVSPVACDAQESGHCSSKLTLWIENAHYRMRPEPLRCIFERSPTMYRDQSFRHFFPGFNNEHLLWYYRSHSYIYNDAAPASLLGHSSRWAVIIISNFHVLIIIVCLVTYWWWY